MDTGENCYRRFLDGDEQGFEELVSLYSRSLTMFICSIIHDSAASEDIMEDTFVELLVHKRRFNPRASFKTYLFSIARHKAIDYLRKNRRSIADPPNEYSENSSETIESEYISGESAVEIRRCIDRLNPDYREVIYLIYFEEMSIDNVAIIMKKNKKSVENLSYRAKKALKVLLKKEVGSFE